MWLHSLACALLQTSWTGSTSGAAPVGPGPWELPTPPYALTGALRRAVLKHPAKPRLPALDSIPQQWRCCRAGLLKQGHFSWEKCMSSSRRKMHSMEGKGPFAARCLCGALGAVCPSPPRAWALTPLCWWCFTSVPGTTQAWSSSQEPAAWPSLTWVRLSTAWMQRWHRPGQRLKWEPFKSLLLLWTKLSLSGSFAVSLTLFAWCRVESSLALCHRGINHWAAPGHQVCPIHATTRAGWEAALAASHLGQQLLFPPALTAHQRQSRGKEA